VFEEYEYRLAVNLGLDKFNKYKNDVQCYKHKYMINDIKKNIGSNIIENLPKLKQKYEIVNMIRY